MSDFPTSKKVLIFVNLVIYVIHLVLNGLSAAGGPDSKLFPNTVGNISRAFHLELTPVGATFSIWGAIFTWELIWIIYTCATVCRSNAPSANILTTRFYIAFILNILFISAWLFVWAREMAIASLVVIVLGQICVDTAIAFALMDLKAFLDDQKILNKTKVDVWCQRILVQNGLIFYATWTTVASLINVAVVAAYRGNASTLTASIISISLLAALAIVWFLLENFAFQKYTEYTFSSYITLIIANIGVYAANNKDDGNETIKWFSFALIILSAIFLVVRIIIIAVRHKRQSNTIAGREHNATNSTKVLYQNY
eukprot:TCONS_00013138-protein